MSTNAWAEQREAVRAGRVLVSWVPSGVPGTCTAAATIETIPMPVGRADYRIIGSPKHSIDLLYLWVHPNLRRCGLMTLILQRLAEAYPSADRFITDVATEDGSGWLKANGFKQTSRGWIVCRGGLKLAGQT